MHVPSEAWIQFDTVYNNIVFGQKLNENKLNKVMSACILDDDIDSLPLGENTKCGDQVGLISTSQVFHF